MKVSVAGKSGAIFSLPENKILVSQGECVKLSAPKPGHYNYYSPDFFGETSQHWYVFPNNSVISVLDLQESLQQKLSKVTPQWSWSEPSFSNFSKVFSSIQKLIATEGFEKLVPVVFEQAKLNINETDLLFMIHSCLLKACDQQVYGLWEPEASENILGVTPEVLFSYDHKKQVLETMALAGTHSLKEKPNSLLESPKERQEHQFVVDSLVQSLKGLGSLSIGETHEWLLPRLKHLKTNINVQLTSSVDIETLITQLHPTPALGVSPSTKDWKVLKKFETSIRRGKYGAPFGVLCPEGSFNCYVAIRNIQWSGEQVKLGSGCGVVKPSLLDMEWSELKLKRNSVKSLLGLVNG